MEIFFTICRIEIWYMLLIIVINKGWSILQYNVKNVFIYIDIDVDIHIIFSIGIYKNNTKCCYLKKAIYGFKQSFCLWYKYLLTALYKHGFIVLFYNEGVYINKETGYILIYYINDILAIYFDKDYIRNLMNKFKLIIKIEELGLIFIFLGNEIIIIGKILYIN